MLEWLTQQEGGKAAREWVDASMKQYPKMDAVLYEPIISKWTQSRGVEEVGEWLREEFADSPFLGGLLLFQFFDGEFLGLGDGDFGEESCDEGVGGNVFGFGFVGE